MSGNTNISAINEPCKCRFVLTIPRNYGTKGGFLSDPVSVSMASSASNGVMFIVPRETGSTPQDYMEASLITSCIRGVSSHEIYVCNISNFIINHTCSGEVAVKLVSTCPATSTKPVCSPFLHTELCVQPILYRRLLYIAVVHSFLQISCQTAGFWNPEEKSNWATKAL